MDFEGDYRWNGNKAQTKKIGKLRRLRRDLAMTGRSRTTFYRDNHNEDNNKKYYNRKTIAIIMLVGALLAAKLYFLWFWL
jgi:hypothetical protein